jgi:hypothetical protein
MHIEPRANRDRHLQIEGGLGWYCLRTRQKQEHLAAAHVRLLEDVAVAEARPEHIVPGEKLGSLVLRFAAHLGAMEGGNLLVRPATNSGAC